MIKSKFIRALLCSAAVIFAFSGAFLSFAKNYSTDEISEIIDGIIAFKESESGCGSVEEWIDGQLTENAGLTSEWYVIGLRQYIGGLDFSGYSDALEKFLASDNTAGASSRQKYSLALTAAGRRESSYITAALEDSIGGQGIMSLAFGLQLLNNGYSSPTAAADEVIASLLALRLSDGGWALAGETSDVDVTAMTVSALALYYDSNAEVQVAVDGALELLSARQLDDGDFSSYGTDNPESTAQVIVALTSLGVDPADDARFIKNGNTLLDGLLKYRLDDGSFRHTSDGAYNHSATSQAFYSLVSVYRLRSGLGPLFIFDESSEPLIETEEAPETDAVPETDAEKITEHTVSPATEAAESSDVQSETEAESENKTSSGIPPNKIAASVIVAAAALIVSLIFIFLGKRSIRNFAFILISAAVVIAVIFSVDIKSADEYYGGAETKGNIAGHVTMSISCQTLLGQGDSEYVPVDGVILAPTEFAIGDGDSVYDILVDAAREYGIQIDKRNGTPGNDDLVYITAINHLYEFDYGELSGWIYHVNGAAPSVGCGGFALSDGDVVEWLYTLELGNDLD